MNQKPPIPEDLKELHASDATWDGGLMVRFAEQHDIPLSCSIERSIRAYLIERIARLDVLLENKKQELNGTVGVRNDWINRAAELEGELAKAKTAAERLIGDVKIAAGVTKCAVDRYKAYMRPRKRPLK